MKIILKETIESLGIIGSEVTVADGYARNYLLPQNKDKLLNIQNIVLVIEIWYFEFIWNLVFVFCFFAIKCTKFIIKVLN